MSVPVFRKYFIPVWRQAPLLRVFIPLAAGMVTCNSLLSAGYRPGLAAFAVSCTCCCLALVFGRRKPLYASGFLAVGLFSLGLVLLQANTLRLKPDFAGRYYAAGHTCIATLQEPPLAKEKSYKANARLALLTPDNRLQPVSGQVIIYVSKDAQAEGLGYGSRIIFRQPLQEIRNSGNPGAFAYREYAARQGIYYQVFLQKHQFTIVPGFHGNRFSRWLFHTRDDLLKAITAFVPGRAENGIAQALLIGYRGDLDKTLVEQYANTGVVHIIAISGMHLGMIYGLLLWLLRPLGTSGKRGLLATCCILAALWWFTLLTGAAPSISRAAVMFSVVAIGRQWKRSGNPYNNLSAAAILLMAWDPYVLWNAGFQLSFAAVLSIYLFYRPILKWYSPAQKALQYLWSMTAVTLSAQILTTPLALWHFHQFPVYFLPANLIAVPLSGIALYGLLVMLALTPLPAMAALAGKAVSAVLDILNRLIGWINTLPFTTISQIEISAWQVWALYGITAALAWWWFKKKPAALIPALAMTLIFVIGTAWRQITTGQQHRLVVYQVPRHAAMDYITGPDAVYLGDSLPAMPGFLQQFHLLPARIRYGYRPVQYRLFDDQENYVFNAGGLRILVLRRQLDYRKSRAVKADILVVSNNVPGNPARILPLIACRQVVMDACNSRSRIARWKSAADSLLLPFHSVPDAGAFEVDFHRLPAALQGRP